MMVTLGSPPLKEQFKTELQNLFNEVLNTEEQYMRDYLLNKGVMDLIEDFEENLLEDLLEE